MEYEHPLYNPGSVAAQARLPTIDTDRVSFAGAYQGWGFHEDGARSGLRAVERLGLTWPDVLPRSPADDVPTGVFETTIRHTRRTPFKRSFTHRSHTWLVDLDDLPDHGVLATFEARDHLGPSGMAERGRHDPRERRRLPPPARHRPGRRPGGDGRARPRLRLLLQPDLGALVLGRVRSARGHGGGGAQHLRRPARLPRPPRRAGPRHDAEGDVRLAVPRHRRHLRPHRARPPRRPARHRRQPDHRRRRDVPRLALRTAYDGRPAPGRARRSPWLAADPDARRRALATAATGPTTPIAHSGGSAAVHPTKPLGGGATRRARALPRGPRRRP